MGVIYEQCLGCHEERSSLCFGLILEMIKSS
jgi:hypothetical protein